MYTGRSV